MARFDTTGIDKVIADMERLGQTVGPVAEEMCMAAVEVIRDAWREAAEKHGLRDTGDMINSIGFGKAPIRAGAILYNDVYPMGTDRKGVRNAEKAFILHYGTRTKPATYWVDDADELSAAPVAARVQAIWDRFLSEGS